MGIIIPMERIVKKLRSSEFVSREAAKQAVIEAVGRGHSPFNAIVMLPAADVRPVVRGKWERKEGAGQYYEVRCSVCGSRPPQDYSGWVVESNYCPNCGADMRPEPPKEET